MNAKAVTSKITKETMIPVGLVIVICGCTWWAATANSAITENTDDNKRQDGVIMEITKNQARTAAILERIETR